VKHSTGIEAQKPSTSLARAILGRRAIWPIVALILIFAVDGLISPGFFHIRIVEGRLFGNLIDILYRAVPTALVALGMAR
jgi:simple sugar transport system permease protein